MSTTHTPAQAAKIAGVSRSTISRAIKRGILPAIKGNQGWQINDDDLQEWMGVQVTVQRTSAEHVQAQQDIEQVAHIARLETENRMLHDSLTKAEAKIGKLEDMLGERWWHPLRDWVRGRGQEK